MKHPMGHDMRKPDFVVWEQHSADQLVYQCSLISTFVNLVSIMTLLATDQISIYQLVSVAEWACLNLTWPQSPDKRCWYLMHRWPEKI